MGDEDRLGYRPKPFKGKEDPLLRALKEAHSDLDPNPLQKTETPASGGEITPDMAASVEKSKGASEPAATTPETSAVAVETPADKIRSILQDVCDEFGTPDNPLTPAQILEKKGNPENKGKDLRIPRHVAAYLLKKITKKSLPQIGKILGDREHSTIAYSCKKIEGMMSDNEAFKARIEALERKIRERYSGNT